MGLLQNITLMAQYALRQNGGIAYTERSTLGPNSFNHLNRYLGEGALYKGDAIPRGYAPPSSIWIGQFASGISTAKEQVAGTGTISNGNAAAGRNASTTADGTSTVSTSNLYALGHLDSSLSGDSTLTPPTIIAAMHLFASLAGTSSKVFVIDAYGNITSDQTGNSTITGNAAGGYYIIADNLTGLGEITNASMELPGAIAALLEGDSILVPPELIAAINLHSALTGGSTLDNAALEALGLISSDITGDSSFESHIANVQFMLSTMYGYSTTDMTMSLAGDVSCLLSGTGEITNADLVSASIIAELVAALSGHASLAPVLSSLAKISADLAGDSDINPSIKAIGTRTSSIAGLGHFVTTTIAAGRNIAGSSTGTGTVTNARATAKANIEATIFVGAQPTAFDITQAVLNAIALQYNLPGTIGEKINTAGSGGIPPYLEAAIINASEEATKSRQVQTNKAVISNGGELVTIYADDGVTILYQFAVSPDKNTRTPI